LADLAVVSCDAELAAPVSGEDLAGARLGG
jgi:hypothetical protein